MVLRVKREMHFQHSHLEVIVMCVLQLFNGTFGHVLERAGGDVQALIQRLEHFYSKVYSSLIIKPFFILSVCPEVRCMAECFWMVEN